MLSRLQADDGQPLQYVNVPIRRARNLGCVKHNGLYNRPSNESLSVHFVKSARGQRYVWEVMHGVAHDPKRWQRMAGVE